jgi:alpha-L-fucosidase
MKYLPQRESLQVHKVPDWFHNAKFGIFIHWGLYSVPAWAPQADNIQDLIKQGWPWVLS